MPDHAALIGKRFAPRSYLVGREKVREYAHAVGETSALHHDPAVARAAGFADVVAPPMFAVVYSAASIWQAYLDPELAIDFPMLVHAGQSFEWGPPVVAGEEITTEVLVSDVRERLAMTFYVFESTSCNESGERVCRGEWTNLVRPRETAAR